MKIGRGQTIHCKPCPVTDAGEGAQFAMLYSALRRCAANLMRSGRSVTLQPTALVHEAWLKVLAAKPGLAGAREDLLAYAASAMRSILVDSVRSRQRRHRVAVRAADDSAAAQVLASFADRTIDVLGLDQALCELAAFDQRMARAIELSYFAGLDQAAIARVLGMTKRTLERELAATRAWLARKLS